MIKGKSYKGVAIEQWSWEHRKKVCLWLEKNFGEYGDRWTFDQDYDFENLIMEDNVYAWYLLKWNTDGS